MSVKRTPTTKATDPIVVCLSSGVLRVAGETYAFRQGERIRSGHPLVGAYPHLFCADGMTDAEYRAARQAMLAARDASA